MLIETVEDLHPIQNLDLFLHNLFLPLIGRTQRTVDFERTDMLQIQMTLAIKALRAAVRVSGASLLKSGR
ncbi:hypothetical protein O2N63_03335 [Aliiroseovarius sp. KMU-50]|uniref:Uncharacterized protein n=1 Tax=Aliiroseovarius salicola TaxID=3009082 RepID=A0ABT4VXZ0_9RHOB|nr:hypothetical protein [Aliiroseovarius sp. KMU-50]MDA5093112.1 hypothetical protein [Aliiroseovarius sp. KMU-50]